MEALEGLVAASPNYVFWPADMPFVEPVRKLCHALTGGNQTTDAYLMALASRKGGKLATFDRGIQALAKTSAAADAFEILDDSRSGVQ